MSAEVSNDVQDKFEKSSYVRVGETRVSWDSGGFVNASTMPRAERKYDITVRPQQIRIKTRNSGQGRVRERRGVR